MHVSRILNSRPNQVLGTYGISRLWRPSRSPPPYRREMLLAAIHIHPQANTKDVSHTNSFYFFFSWFWLFFSPLFTPVSFLAPKHYWQYIITDSKTCSFLKLFFFAKVITHLSEILAKKKDPHCVDTHTIVIITTTDLLPIDLPPTHTHFSFCVFMSTIWSGHFFFSIFPIPMLYWHL